MLTAEQKTEVQQALQSLTKPFALIVQKSKTEHPLNQKLLAFAEELAALSEQITVTERNAEDDLPALGFHKEDGGWVWYAGLPELGEWPPFMQTLAVAAGSCPIPADGLSSLPVSEQPRSFDVFVMPHCVFCPQAALLVNCLALMHPGITSRIIDAQANMELASKIGVRSTPTILLDGVLRWVGQLGIANVPTLLQNESESWQDTLKSQINTGSVEETVQTVLKNNDAAEQLPYLLQKPELSLHMAVLRVIEDAVAEQADIGKKMLNSLDKLTRHSNPLTRGDAAYALGLINLPQAIPILKRCLQDENEDVQDSARDSLEMLGEAVEGN